MGRKTKYTDRRSVLRALGAAGIASVAGCSGGGGGNAATTTEAPTEAPTTTGGGGEETATPSMEEQIQAWRKKASEKAAAELAGDEQLVFYASSRNKKYLARRTTKLAQTLEESWVQDADLYQPLVDNFKNIEGSRGKLVQRYAQEAAAGKRIMDVLSGGAGSAIAKGVPFANIPERVPVSQLLPDDAVNNKQAALYLFPWGPGVNTDLVSDPPKTRQDLLRDRFSDNSILGDFTPPPDSVIPVMLMEGEEYIKKLAEQKPQFTGSVYDVSKSVAQGQAKISWQGLGSHIIQFQNQGLPIKMAENPELWHVAPQWMQMAAKPQHPWAAALFTDFLIRPEHREIQIGRTGTISLDGKAANPSRLLDFVTQGNPDIWGRHKYDKTSSELLEQYLKFIGAPTN